jgi:hypothetical protein
MRQEEPLWKTVLCWGAVITFLTMPLFLFALHVVSNEVSWLHFREHLSEYKYLGTFFQTVTALVFGLAGLNTLSPLINRPQQQVTPYEQRPPKSRSDA